MNIQEQRFGFLFRIQVAAQANPGSSARMPQVQMPPDEARRKMNELVSTLFTFEQDYCKFTTQVCQ